jgi:putative addiction module component (TIGR02574 family)
MASKLPISDLLSLSAAERILLVETIWDSIADFPEAVKLTQAQRVELDTRLQAYDRNPEAGSPWDVVKARIAPIP